MIEFLEEPPRRADCLVVAFTGLWQALGGIPFEFHKSMTKLDCAALFVRDQGQRWYQYDDAAESVLARIDAAKRAAGASRLACIGNSMGGFGALYFGARAGADAILAFSPQSAIDKRVTDEIGDIRWLDFQAKIPAYPFGDLLDATPSKARPTVVIGADDVIDIAHVERIAEPWNLDVLRVADSDHNAVQALKERGDLMPLIERALLGSH